MIQKIFFEQFKGQTGAQDLTGRDIFIGRNGSGKSTRIQALTLAKLGYVPQNGKTKQETMKLSSSDEMAVSCHTTEGFSFERRFKRAENLDRKTSKRTIEISQSVDVVPGKGEGNDTQREARIAAEVGSDSYILDFNEFLSLTDTKRREFFYALSPVKSEEWDRNHIWDYLSEQLLTSELESNNPEHYQIMVETLTEAMSKFPDGWSVADGLQAMIDWVSTQLTFWNGKKKDSQGAVRQLAELKNNLEQTDRNIAAEKVELEQLQQQLIKVEKQISMDTEKKKAIDNRVNRIQDLDGQITKLLNTPLTEINVDDLNTQICDIQIQIKEVDHTQKIEQLTASLGAIAKRLMVSNDARDKCREKLIQIKTELATLLKSLKTIGGAGGTCFIDRRIKCEKDFTKYQEFVEASSKKASEETAKIQTEMDEIDAQITDLKNEETQVKDEIAKLTREERQQATQNNLLKDRILSLERQKNEALTAKERLDNQINLLQDELTRLTNMPADPIAPIDISQKQSEGLCNRIKELKSSIDEKGKARQTILLMQQSMLENKTADLKAACLKSISEMLGPKGIQGELVKGILDPIRKDIGKNLIQMGFDVDPYFQTESETGREVFQFGWVNGRGSRVNFDSMSTGQQTVFLAAMMVTIIDLAKPKLRMLVMDNLNHLDRENFQMFIYGLSAVSNKLDNIILAGAIEFEFTAPGWKVWDLTPEREEVAEVA